MVRSAVDSRGESDESVTGDSCGMPPLGNIDCGTFEPTGREQSLLGLGPHEPRRRRPNGRLRTAYQLAPAVELEE